MGMFNRKKKNQGSAPSDQSFSARVSRVGSSSGSIQPRSFGFGSKTFRNSSRSKTVPGIPLSVTLSPVSDINSPFNQDGGAGSDAHVSNPEVEDSDSFTKVVNSPPTQTHHCAASLPVLSPTMAAIEARTEEMFRGMRRSKHSSGDTTPHTHPLTNPNRAQRKVSIFGTRGKSISDSGSYDLNGNAERKWSHAGIGSLPGFFSRRGTSTLSYSSVSDLPSYWTIDYNDITIGKTIGHSSFGNVCQGKLNGTNVAVKIIACESADVVTSFQKEAELTCKLRHPNIVLFMGICVQPTKVCLVTELMSRGNVRELLVDSSVQLEWPLRLQWALDTARGMAYLHSLDPPMIHCDLKTTNLLVDKGMNVKICDFGLSRFKSEKITSAVGTVHFSAPEVLRNELYSEGADLFSFGTVMWELYTRKCVFDGMSRIDVYQSVMNGLMPEVDDDCDDRYQSLMRHCWAMNPKDRPTFQEVIERLSLLVENDDDQDC